MATTFGDIETRARKAVGDTQSSATLTAAGVEAKVREIVGDVRASSTLTAANIEAKAREIVGDVRASATLTGSVVMARAREIVNDQTSGSYRFSDTIMLQYVWDGIRELGNIRPLYGTIAGSGSGTLPVDSRWGGCLEQYVAFRCYQIDDSDTANAKLASDCFALFTALAKQTPYAAPQSAMIGYVWEGIRELCNVRPIVGTNLGTAISTGLSASGTGSIVIDDRWGGCLAHYVAFRYYQADTGRPESEKSAAEHFNLFLAMAKATPYVATQVTMVGYVWEGVRELGNIRPLGVSNLASTVATGLSTGGTGSLTIDDRWSGSLEHYVASRYYQADVGNAESGKLAVHHFKMFDVLARQTPHRVEQQDMLGFAWEGVQRLWSTRPESRYVGLSLVSWAPPADGSFSAAEAMPTDMRWDGAVVEYVCFKYYMRDAKNGESARHAARHLELFTNWSSQ